MSTSTNHRRIMDQPFQSRMSDRVERRRSEMLEELLDEMDVVHRRRRRMRSGVWAFSAIVLFSTLSLVLANRMQSSIGDPRPEEIASNTPDDSLSRIFDSDGPTSNQATDTKLSPYRYINRARASNEPDGARRVESVSGGHSTNLTFIRRISDDELVSELHRSGIDAGLIRIGGRAVVSRPADDSTGRILVPGETDPPTGSFRSISFRNMQRLVSGELPRFAGPHLFGTSTGPIS